MFEIAEGVKLTMCWIPAGEFVMGSPKDSDATPHPVKLTQGFWLSQTELTQEQWRRRDS
jgi:formylglycine-generating enzyme required for sulfatase activity